MSLGKEFRAFILKGNIVDLAIAVVIGGAFGKIVTAFVDDLVMPLVGAILPGGDWRNLTASSLNIKVGHFIGSIVDFLIIAFVVFVALVKVVGTATRHLAADAGPATKSCGECLETIPAAAKRCRACTAVVTGLALVLLCAGVAHAADPKFEYGKHEDVKAVEWKAAARAGLTSTTGNSRTFATTAGLSLTRKHFDNKLGLEGGLAYARSSLLKAVDAPTPDGMGGVLPPDGTISPDETAYVTSTTTNAWNVKARYDRFLTANNSAYASGQLARDRPAGKELTGGGQVGYSRQLVKNERHILVAELGYDFSFEKYVLAGSDPVQIHSARAFVGETLTMSPSTGVLATFEVLTNLNAEKAAAPGYATPAAGEDTRLAAKVGLNTTLIGKVSFGFSFGLRYDNSPAPRPAPPMLKWAAGYNPTVDKLDTLTEASLIVTFL